MTPILLTEQDVRELIDMPDSIEIVEQAFQQLAAGNASNIPRARVNGAGCLLHTMSAAANYLKLVGWKAYTTTRSSMTFHVAAYDSRTGDLQALIEADWLGQLRTGAASGVATRHMAREDASTVGLLGTGTQGRTQLMAVCSVRKIARVEVFGRDVDRRKQFCAELSDHCDTDVVPVETPQQAVSEKAIVITATTAREPVFNGSDLAPGTHVNAIGSNFLQKTEIDVETVRRSSRIVCDSIEQCKLEAGDFRESLKQSVTDWSAIDELADVVTQRKTGRKSDTEITLFKSVGLAIEDVAMAGELIQRAESAGRGIPVPGSHDKA